MNQPNDISVGDVLRDACQVMHSRHQRSKRYPNDYTFSTEEQQRRLRAFYRIQDIIFEKQKEGLFPWKVSTQEQPQK